MNIPNTITLVRVVLIPFFVDLMIYGYHGEALIVFISACLTDALDGLVARLTNSRTELGAFLDPMADKLLVVSSFVTLAILAKLPIWIVIIVVSRDIILVMGSLVIYITGHRLTVRPSPVGKATTVLQFTVVAVTLVFVTYNIGHDYLVWLYWATAAATIVSGLHYVSQGMRIMG